MGIVLKLFLSPIIAAAVWVFLNRDEQRRVGGLLKEGVKGLLRHLLLLFGKLARKYRFIGNYWPLILMEYRIMAFERGQVYRGPVFLETSEYMVLNLRFLNSNSYSQKKHYVDVIVADESGRIYHQARFNFVTKPADRITDYSSDNFEVAGNMSTGRWNIFFSVDGKRKKSYSFRILSFDEVFTLDGGISENYAYLFG